MIYHFIMNPKSGRHKRLGHLEDTIKEACQSRNLKYHIYYTACQGDATEYVRSMLRITPDQKQRFICVGGDGTLNEIVNADPINPNGEYGVIPSGTGNDFIKNFTREDLFSSVEAQLDGKAVALDIIKCNEYYCMNMANIGFDCAAAKKASELKKWRIPPALAYIFGVGIVIFKKFGTRMKLVFDDGKVIDKKLTLTAIGNGKYCGGGFKAAPKANLTDGIFDVCAVNKISRLTFITLVGAYRSGTYTEKKRAAKVFNHITGSHFIMEFDDVTPICLDGEIVEAQTAEFTIIPRAVNFVIPDGSEMI